MKRIIINFLTVSIISLTITTITSMTFPQEEWEHSSAQEAGFSNKTMNQLRELLEKIKTTSMVVAYQGKIIFEYGDTREVSYTASCRKNFLASIFWMAPSEQNSLETTLDELGINDVGGLSDQEKTASIENLLQARSGVYHRASNEGGDTTAKPRRDSYLPGEHFLYNNWDFNAICGIFELLTEQNFYDAFQNEIALPIRMQDFDRSIQRKVGIEEDSSYLAYYTWLSTRDHARFGHLMLNNGNWDGEQLIPEEWIDHMKTVTTPSEDLTNQQIPSPRVFDHCMMNWWKLNAPDRPWDGGYIGAGAFGQYVTIFEDRNLVIAHKTSIAHDTPEIQEAWDAYMHNPHLPCPKNRSSVSAEQYLDILDLLLKEK